MINLLKKMYIYFFTYIFRIFPINEKNIMFCNFFGKGYGCNSKYICEYIIENKIDYNLIWIVDSMEYKFPKEIIKVKKYSLKYFYYLATSKFFVDNQHKGKTFKKRKKQYFIKTWHAMLGLKKIGLDNPSTNLKYAQMLEYNNKITNLMISNSNYIENKFKRVFAYTGEFFQCGFPRVDILINQDKQKINEIKNNLKIDKNKKILLYAPTFREDLSLRCYNINLENVLKTLNKKTNEEWIVIIKLHPHLGKAKLDYDSENIINVSEYDDIQELLLISDILVTDYSNIMFEFGLTNKPVFLYATDYEEYKITRDYYFKYEELPFLIAFNNEEMIEKIKQFDDEVYIKKLKEFYINIDYKEDGKATERLVKKIQSISRK